MSTSTSATDGGAFEALMAPFLVGGYRLALVLLGDREAAEDAVQEATTRAWRSMGQLREQTAIRPWFMTIVANECRAMRRRRWWRVTMMGDAPPVSLVPDPGGALEALDLRRAVAGLGTNHRIVVGLHYYLDLPIDEVAAIVGAPVGTIKSRLHRAVTQLRARLDLPAEEER